MPATLEPESTDTFLLRCSGSVKRSEFSTVQAALARAIDGGAKPRLLTLMTNFEGWEKNADWNDLDFQMSYGGSIEKIAIVGEPRWEGDAMAFAGAGFRRAPVKFFPAGQEVQARAWLAE